MAYVPLINSSSSLTIHLYCHFRTDDSAQSASRTLAITRFKNHHIVPFGVQLPGGFYEASWTKLHTKGTPLAQPFIYYYLPCHGPHPEIMKAGIQTSFPLVKGTLTKGKGKVIFDPALGSRLIGRTADSGSASGGSSPPFPARRSHRLARLGHRPLTSATGVQIPLGPPFFQALTEPSIFKIPPGAK